MKNNYLIPPDSLGDSPSSTSINHTCIFDPANPLNFTQEIYNLLYLFNVQLHIVLDRLEGRLDTKKWRKFTYLVGKGFRNLKLGKKGKKTQELTEDILANCQKIIALSHVMELILPSLFANLIINADAPNGWTRVLSIGMRPSQMSWQETFIVINPTMAKLIPDKVIAIFSK